MNSRKELKGKLVGVAFGLGLICAVASASQQPTSKRIPEAAAHKTALNQACSSQTVKRTEQCTSEMIWCIGHIPADPDLVGAGMYLAALGDKKQKQQILDTWMEAVKSHPDDADIRNNARFFDGYSQLMGAPESRTAATELTQRKATNQGQGAPVGPSLGDSKSTSAADSARNAQELPHCKNPDPKLTWLDTAFDQNNNQENLASAIANGRAYWWLNLAIDGSILSKEWDHGPPQLRSIGDRPLRGWKYHPVPEPCRLIVIIDYHLARKP